MNPEPNPQGRIYSVKILLVAIFAGGRRAPNPAVVISKAITRLDRPAARSCELVPQYSMASWIRHLQLRIHLSRVQPDGIVFRRAGRRTEAAFPAWFLGLPGLQSFFNLLRKPPGIGGGAKCFVGEDRRSLMMSVTITIRP